MDVLDSLWLTTGKYALEFEKKFSESLGGQDIISLAVNAFLRITGNNSSSPAAENGIT